MSSIFNANVKYMYLNFYCMLLVEQMAKVLAEQRRLLTEGLTAIAQELERVQNFDSEEGEILKPIGEYRIKAFIT